MKSKKSLVTSYLLPVTILIFLIPVFVFAQGTTFPIGNPLSINDPRDLIGVVISGILGLVGSLALVMFIIGGLTWMTAAGNPEKVQKGKGVLVWAVVGLFVIFTSYVVVQFLISAVTQDVEPVGDTGERPGDIGERPGDFGVR